MKFLRGLSAGKNGLVGAGRNNPVDSLLAGNFEDSIEIKSTSLRKNVTPSSAGTLGVHIRENHEKSHFPAALQKPKLTAPSPKHHNPFSFHFLSPTVSAISTSGDFTEFVDR